ncbi:LysM peptidoglycan-binding domain-containing protein [Ligilactobacillus agilis]|uniref:LysM peptidoglycan-binding domain-containing protein n=1 Tax=Ligilactobacillus agilis TaxID=1601 RepID=A0A9Q9N0A9_9LACO|nr:LysM peptidoglycan-binding domain-containing protein [Ligilactobacillus agilis]UXC65349.1 LysM peptidoglycan-binding domain-containing protein [Ligilactobacillus agilis]
MNNTTKKILFGTVGAAGLFLASSASVNADTTHHVVKNDTVWDLSQKYGVSIQSIEQLNKINTDTHLIREGQTLTIPTTGKTAAKTATKTSQVTVKAGDTLWALAQKYGTTVEKLRQLNGLASDAYLIHVGDVIKVDGQVTTTTTTNAQATSTVSSEASQTSQAAATASSEANQTSQATSTASSEASQAASTSQAATPYVAANHVTYTVQAGDSLYTIAQKYGVTVDSLRQANTLGATLQVGQSLTVNDPTKNPQASVAASQAEQTPAQTTTTSQATQATQTTQAATTTNQVAQTTSQTTSQPAAQTQTQTSQASQTTQTSQQTQASQAQVATPSSYSVSALLSYAQTFTGVPYVLGGTTPAGFDCSGFTQYVFNHFGKNIGRTTYQQQYAGTKLAVSSAQPGDLLFWGAYGSAYHVGIYLGGSSYIAAPEPGESVSVKSFTYYQPSFAVHVN